MQTGGSRPPPDLNDFRPGGRAPAGEAGGKKSKKYYYNNTTNNLLMMMMMMMIFFPCFPKNIIIFNITKILQTLKPTGTVRYLKISPLHSHNCLFIFTPKPNLT